MPEGDTLYRIATRLKPVLCGETIVDAWAWRALRGPQVDASSLVGRRVESVEAIGKHLLIALDDRRVVHSHLGMTGSWHVYAPGNPWRKPERRAALVLMTDSWVVVNFTPKLLEVVSQSRLRGDALFHRLGPDLMLDHVSLAEVIRRMRSHGSAPIGVAVMNQSIAAGIGNVYKSESLFLAQLNPWSAVSEFDDGRLTEYLTLVQALMRKNRGTGVRRTRFAGEGPRLWVYGRRNAPCLKCGDLIQTRSQGDLARTTYYCPRCQGVGVVGSGGG